jgi:hypothetical protein
MHAFRRDANGALINIDKNATLAYKQQRAMGNDINTLHNQITKLEDLIQQLLRGQNDISKQ